MENDLGVTRDVELDLSEEELWRLVGDGAAWAEWLADASDVEVVPGGEGDVVDDGERRHVQVDEVEPGRRVGYRWWPDQQPDVVSTVELVIVPRPAGSTLRITETRRARALASPAAAGAPDLRWSVRAVLLWCRSASRVPA